MELVESPLALADGLDGADCVSAHEHVAQNHGQCGKHQDRADAVDVSTLALLHERLEDERRGDVEQHRQGDQRDHHHEGLRAAEQPGLLRRLLERRLGHVGYFGSLVRHRTSRPRAR